MNKEKQAELQKQCYILQGLSCPACALKMEKEISEIPDVEMAYIDFINKRLMLELTPSSNNLKANISKIVKNIEAHVEIHEETTSEKSLSPLASYNPFKLLRILAGIVIFMVTLVSDFSQDLSLILFVISYLLTGADIVFLAIKNIFKGHFLDENFLMGLATLGAFAIGEYPEAVAVMVFYQIGEFFQDMALNHSRKSISSLMNIRPDYANLLSDNNYIKVSPENVQPGDIIMVKPGEKIPLDGTVVQGSASLDISALTGESIPKDVEANDSVLSGSINLNGIITIRVTSTFKDSTASKILELVQNAGSRKSVTENFITIFAKYYTPIVVILAFIIAFLPPLFLLEPYSKWINRALVFLVVSCPCALVISIPLSFFGGIGAASKKGILVKGGNFLEALSNVSTVVFDKTGTLTKGDFSVTSVVPANNFSSAELLKYAALAENHSNHPIALSIVKAYENPLNLDLIDNYTELSGYGIHAEIKGKSILVGNSKLMYSKDISFKDVSSSSTIVHIAIDNIYAGYLTIADQLRPDSINAISGLKKIAINRLVMLTGDNSAIAASTADSLGIDSFYSELLPHQKVEIIEKLEAENEKNSKLVFIGDGINDAPVLARADIGIAMGALGSDAAIEAADIVFMNDEPSKIITAIEIAKKTKKIVWQNIVFALSIKALVLLLGAVGLATMWAAVFADVGVALLAVLNAMRILKTQ